VTEPSSRRLSPLLLIPLAGAVWRLLARPWKDAWADAALWIFLWLLYSGWELRPERRRAAVCILMLALMARHCLEQLPWTLDMIRSL
jgi:hypothetical protein